MRRQLNYERRRDVSYHRPQRLAGIFGGIVVIVVVGLPAWAAWVYRLWPDGFGIAD